MAPMLVMAVQYSDCFALQLIVLYFIVEFLVTCCDGFVCNCF